MITGNELDNASSTNNSNIKQKHNLNCSTKYSTTDWQGSYSDYAWPLINNNDPAYHLVKRRLEE